MAIEISINGTAPFTTPQDRVMAVEAATKAICQSVGQDPADGVMMLLTAACHLSMQATGKPAKDLLETLAYSLGCATVAADDFFSLKQV